MRVVVVDGVYTGLLGRFGCVEVGFADAQADDVDALGFQFTAFVAKVADSAMFKTLLERMISLMICLSVDCLSVDLFC